MLWQLTLAVLGRVHQAGPRAHLGQLLGSGLVLASLCAVVAGRLGRGRGAVALGALAGSALAVAITLTLFRDAAYGRLVGLQGCAVTDPTVLSVDGVANVALFAPAAFFGVLAVGRPGRVAAAVAGVSLAVEEVQALTSVGVCDTSDALLNAVGGLVAALAAALLRSTLVPREPEAPDPVPVSDPCRRSC